MYIFAIIDDQLIDIKKMHKAIDDHCSYHHIPYAVDYFNNPLDFTFDKHYDAVFLDIDMPDMSGMTLARRLNEMNPTHIIFMSQYSEYIHATMNVRPFHFIHKHLLEKESIQVLSLLFHELQSKLIKLKTKRGEENVSIDDIYYISISNNMATVHTLNKSYIVWESLSSLYKKLQQFHFEKTHQSILVNMKYIQTIQNNKVILTNQVDLKLSTRSKTILKKAYENYLLEDF